MATVKTNSKKGLGKVPKDKSKPSFHGCIEVSPLYYKEDGIDPKYLNIYYPKENPKK